MVTDFVIRSFGLVLWVWPLLLLVIAVAWRNEVLRRRELSGQAELKSLIEQVRHETARVHELASENSFVAWEVERAGADRIRVVNVGHDGARSVTVTASGAAGTAERTVSSVPAPRGDGAQSSAVEITLPGSGGDEVRVEVNWRSPLGRWSTERRVLR
ncbi:hypothetical protein [Mycolicibacterium goodii]|uniref:hypothetical protein n=1 Tax=Mycolicibacterium goodii TaxID=134601 RepID=UPI0012FF917E